MSQQPLRCWVRSLVHRPSRPRRPTPRRRPKPASCPPSPSPPSGGARTSRTCRARSARSAASCSTSSTPAGRTCAGLAGRVPNLNIESSFGRAFPRFYIRGYGNTDFRLNASQPVSLVYDDVVQENPILKGFPAFDLDRHRGAARPAGHAVRPQHAGRRGQVRFGAADHASSRATAACRSAPSAPSTPKARSTCRPARIRRCALSLLNQTRNDWVHNTVPTGLTQDFEGYRDSALRGQWLYEPHKDFSAAGQPARARPQRLGAAVPRQHHPAGHQRPGAPASTRRQISTDGKNEQTLHHHRRQPAPALGPGRRGAVLDHRLRARQGVQPRRHRRRLRRGVRAAFRAGADPVLVGDRRRHAQAPAVDAGVPPRVHHRGAVELAGRRLLLPRGLQGRELQLRLADRRQRAGRLRARRARRTMPGRDLRRRQLRGDAGASRCAAACATRRTRRTSTSRTTTAPCSAPCPTWRRWEPAGPLSASTKDNKTNWDLSGTYALDKSTNLYARVATGFRGQQRAGRPARSTAKSVADAREQHVVRGRRQVRPARRPCARQRSASSTTR